jgi:hypothetical protein
VVCCAAQLNKPKVLSLLVQNVGTITHSIKAAYQVRAVDVTQQHSCECASHTQFAGSHVHSVSKATPAACCQQNGHSGSMSSCIMLQQNGMQLLVASPNMVQVSSGPPANIVHVKCLIKDVTDTAAGNPVDMNMPLHGIYAGTQPA